jgi:YesN/AraC family two-component response regulator
MAGRIPLTPYQHECAAGYSRGRRGIGMRSSEYSKIDDSICIEKKIGRSRSYKSNPHYHNACEIHYFLEGDITFFIHDQSYRVKKGDILFIDTYEIHNPVYKQYDYEKILITYKPSFTELNPKLKVPDVFSILNKKHGGIRLVSIPPQQLKQIESVLFDMLDAYTGQSQHKLIYLNSYLTLFLTHLADYLETASMVNDQVSLLNQKIKSIISHINVNLDKPLTLEEISDHFNVSKYYLCRFFKQHTGLSVIDYTIRKRILTAEKLILQNKHSITDISMMVGFNNLTHFERTFKKLIGTPPRSYKINNSQEISR